MITYNNDLQPAYFPKLNSNRDIFERTSDNIKSSSSHGINSVTKVIMRFLKGWSAENFHLGPNSLTEWLIKIVPPLITVPSPLRTTILMFLAGKVTKQEIISTLGCGTGWQICSFIPLGQRPGVCKILAYYSYYLIIN